jgi:reductive dehalogenase
MIKKVARWLGADLVGICKLDRRWVYSHTLGGVQLKVGDPRSAGVESRDQEIPEEFQYVIVLGYEMDYELMKYMPTYLAGAASSMGYSRMAITNNYLTHFIRNLGFKVIDCSINDVALSIPLAMQAGIGDIARNGLLVTQKYGPRVRLNSVITDLPLELDSPVDFGVTEFCRSCEICADRCPSQSIIHGERTPKAHNISNVEGVLKWPVNAETCRMQWARANTSCAVCITVCPYNKPNTWFHRFVRWCTDHARWADPFYVKADIWAGYGKIKKADNFWEEWKPKSN